MRNAKSEFCDITGTVTKMLRRETQSEALTVKQNTDVFICKGQKQKEKTERKHRGSKQNGRHKSIPRALQKT